MELISLVLAMGLFHSLLGASVSDEPVLRAGFHKGDIRVVSCVGVGQIGIDGREVQVREDVSGPLLAMLAHAASDGFEIRINFGFRDHREQKRQWRRSRRLAAPPGYSNHQSGVSIDVNGTRMRVGRRLVRTALYRWLVVHGRQYGFVNDIPREPWHWTFIGVEGGDRVAMDYAEGGNKKEGSMSDNVADETEESRTAADVVNDKNATHQERIAAVQRGDLSAEDLLALVGEETPE